MLGSLSVPYSLVWRGNWPGVDKEAKSNALVIPAQAGIDRTLQLRKFLVRAFAGKTDRALRWEFIRFAGVRWRKRLKG